MRLDAFYRERRGVNRGAPAWNWGTAADGFLRVVRGKHKTPEENVTEFERNHDRLPERVGWVHAGLPRRRMLPAASAVRPDLPRRSLAWKRFQVTRVPGDSRLPAAGKSLELNTIGTSLDVSLSSVRVSRSSLLVC